MLDTSGVDKETKKQMDHISHLMSTLARLGRAPGINLILATQRPDAKVLCGQIKANLPIRISGIMVDDYNSEMVLGNTKAVEINPDIKGRFMYSQGVETHEFQAYAFNPSFIETGKYRIGKMLIDSPEAAGMNRQSVKEIDEPETNQYRDIFKAKQIEAEQKAEIPEKDTKENENINAAGDPATVWNGLKVKGFN
jgi:hypothetical protein